MLHCEKGEILRNTQTQPSVDDAVDAELRLLQPDTEIKTWRELEPSPPQILSHRAYNCGTRKAEDAFLFVSIFSNGLAVH